MISLLAKAGISKVTKKGTLDFHALRMAYINFLLPITDAKTAQTLARHATLNLTMNVYGRAREAALTKAAQQIGDLFPADFGWQNGVISREEADTTGQGEKQGKKRY